MVTALLEESEQKDSLMRLENREQQVRYFTFRLCGSLAEAQRTERLEPLREYEERLADGRAAQIERYAAEAEAVWAVRGVRDAS